MDAVGDDGRVWVERPLRQALLREVEQPQDRLEDLALRLLLARVTGKPRQRDPLLAAPPAEDAPDRGVQEAVDTSQQDVYGELPGVERRTQVEGLLPRH